LVGVDTDHDLAVISIDSTDLTPVKFGSTEDLLVGDPAIAIGYPLGLEGGPSVSTGIVSAKGRTITDSTASLSGIIQTDAAITEGSSGGALLDAQGSLVGITTAVGVSSVGIEGIGFAIPIETIEQVLPELLATG
ncbi:MAG: trypsin-like peptidase domain-containing protein, partial [Acidimicrobiia bacterium]